MLKDQKSAAGPAMYRSSSFLLTVALLLVVFGSPASSDTQSPEVRKQVAPLIRALTDCVARQTLADPNGASAFRGNTFSPFAVRMVSRCQADVNALIDTYDRAAGEGAGIAFLNGPYAADLPRAVLKRIQPKLQAQLDARDRAQADEAVRLSQQAADDAFRTQSAKAERQVALAQSRTAEARARAEEEAAAADAEAERRRHIDEERRSADLLVQEAANCARKQLVELVRSGETADVLATAAMTICSDKISAFIDQSVKEVILEKRLVDDADDTGANLLRSKFRDELRSQLVTLAVQVKAGTGAFAPSSD